MIGPQRTAFFVFVLCGLSFSAEVTKLTSDPKLVGISLSGESLYMGDIVCFERNGENLGCGKITKLFKKGAAVELDSADSGLRVGDQIIGRAPSSIEETPVATPVSVETMTKHKQSLLGKVNVGVNYPDYSATSSTYSKLFSYLIGIGAEIPLSPALSLEPSLFYSPEWVSATSSSVTARVSVSYLEVPIYLKVKPFYRSINKISPYFLIGPSYGYLLSAKLTYEGIDTPETDFTPLLNSSRFSANIAMGFDTDVSESLTLGFSVRYLLAISSPTRGTSNSSSARLFQGLVTLGWNYEEDVFD